MQHVNCTLQLCRTSGIVFELYEELPALSGFWKLCDCYVWFLVDLTLSQINPVHSSIYSLIEVGISLSAMTVFNS